MEHKIINIVEKAKDPKFCLLPFSSLQVGTNFLSPCCKTSVSSLSPDIQTRKRELYRYLSGAPLIKLKTEFLNGNIPDQCSHCFGVGDNSVLYPMEKARELSLLVNRYGTDPNIDVLKNNTINLNFTLSNTCNLACRMCFPSSSTTLNRIWDNELTDISGITAVPNDQQKLANAGLEEFIECLINDDRLKNVLVVTLSGGEPLMHKNLLKWVNTFVEKTQIKSIFIVTNASWDKFGFIDDFGKMQNPEIKGFTISIDGPPKMHEYVRAGIDINQFEQTVDKILKYDFNLCSTITLSAINIHEVVGALNYANSLFGDRALIRVSYVENPYLRVGVLPKELQQRIKNKIITESDGLDFSKFKNPETTKMFIDTVIGYIDKELEVPFNPESFKSFKAYTSKMDQIHGTNIFDVFPDLQQFWSEY